MNENEVRELGKTLIAIANGAEWQIQWSCGKWTDAVNGANDPIECACMNVPIRIKPE